MNIEDIASQRVIIDAEATALEKAISAAVESKNYTGIADLEHRTAALEEARAELKRHEDNASSAAFAAKMGGSFGDLATQPVKVITKAMTGAQLNPLRISDANLKALHSAASSKQTYATKAFSTVDGLLPAQLDPSVLGKVHENRLLDYIPVRPITAPSLEVIVHSSTTGAPTPVAEGGTKPEVVLNTSAVTFTAIKLAAHVGIPYETLQDFQSFEGYAHTELMRQIQDVENAQLLSGSGTTGNMTGFAHTSGVLTHDASADTGTGVTALDSIEESITALRTGSSLAEANLLVLNPSTFSAIRRLKNTLGNFLIGDPSVVGARQLFGVPVLLTTAQAAGTGVLLDTTKFGFVAVREGLTVHVGQSGTDFVQNISRFVMEERLVLAVERPSAVLVISNLPTS